MLKIPMVLRDVKTYFLLLLAPIIIINTISHIKHVHKSTLLRKSYPYSFDGIKFSGLDDILQGQKFVGYYTDKDLDEKAHAQQFAQAQYQLVPIVLDLNNASHEFVFFDCSSEGVAWQKIEELGLFPLRKNHFGIILARNPKPLK